MRLIPSNVYQGAYGHRQERRRENVCVFDGHFPGSQMNFFETILCMRFSQWKRSGRWMRQWQLSKGRLAIATLEKRGRTIFYIGVAPVSYMRRRGKEVDSTMVDHQCIIGVLRDQKW